MPQLFTFGRKIYSDRVYALNSNDLQQFFKLYKMKYWGLVESEQWQDNEKSARQNEGEIRAKYLTESGTEVFLVRSSDRNNLYFLLQEDFEDEFIQKYEERIREEARQHEAEMERMRQAQQAQQSGRRNRNGDVSQRTRTAISSSYANEYRTFFESPPIAIVEPVPTVSRPIADPNQLLDALESGQSVTQEDISRVASRVDELFRSTFGDIRERPQPTRRRGPF